MINSMFIYLENPKRATKKLLECLSGFGKILDYKVNVDRKKRKKLTEKSTVFLIEKM